MGVPTVGFSVSDFKGAYQAPHWFYLHPRTTSTQDLERFALLGDEILEAIPVLVGEGEGNKHRRQALGLGPGKGMLNLKAAALLDTGSADGAGPDAATGHKTGVEGRAVLKGAHDFDIRMPVMTAITGAVTVSRVAGGVQGTSAAPEDIGGVAEGLIFEGAGSPCGGPVRGGGRGFRSGT